MPMPCHAMPLAGHDDDPPVLVDGGMALVDQQQQRQQGTMDKGVVGEIGTYYPYNG